MKTSTRFTLVPRLETVPALVELAQKLHGKLLLLAAFTLGLWLHHRHWWWEMSIVLAVLTLWPARRRWWIAGASVYWLFRHTTFQWELLRSYADALGVRARVDLLWVERAALVAGFGFCLGFVVLLRRAKRPFFLRRPVAALLTANFALIVVATATALDPLVRVGLFAFVLVLVRYIWFLAYSAIYPEPKRPALLVVGQYLPFWIGSNGSPNPIPKGAGYLDRIEAKTAGELAVCQLKALKLLFWAGILAALHHVASDLCYGSDSGLLARFGIAFDFGLPTATRVLMDSVLGYPHALWLRWASLIADFADDVFVLAIWGHVLVACARMAGFQALRNTYRPLEATSIAEFWNRYFFYFKEVLVDVFFYPTYFRWFKAHPRLRKFAATLAAACFGNFLYHYLRNLEGMAFLGPWGTLLAMRAYMLYCAILGLAIGVSQMRAKRNTAGEHWLRRRCLRPGIVLAFYCLLKVLEIPGTASLSERLRFLASLAGVHV